GKHTVLYTFQNAVAAPPHQGVLGLALDPQILKGNNYVYTAYTYEVNGEKHARIVRMNYDPKTETLRDETAILDNLPASVDHNSGRLRFGPDGKLYYTI
ncbi:PQQ-dependent sugar dehydrogenase, partial [Megasphaera massiliensis]|uniref:PQQ-dependent sugar dehydrogenase n=1 Tax=Megasphaera massiliensis TaxID=1232428 RepID=UPI00210D8F50